MKKTPPISTPQMASPAVDQVAQRAYQLWETRGRPDGTGEEDWYQAERELREATPPPADPSSASIVSSPQGNHRDQQTAGQRSSEKGTSRSQTPPLRDRQEVQPPASVASTQH